jgi:hypothetical protein
MNDLLDYLYMYAAEQQMLDAIQPFKQEYDEAFRACDRLLDQLKAKLGNKRWKMLDDFLSSQNEAQYLDRMALFRCGLGIGLRLARLAD